MRWIPERARLAKLDHAQKSWKQRPVATASEARDSAPMNGISWTASVCGFVVVVYVTAMALCVARCFYGV